MLDIKKLTYLDAVYRHKNFTKASEELYISQPAISTAISSLEKEYKVRLLTRTPKDVSFTPEGEKFMIHVSRILSNCREAQQALADMSEETRNTLRLGISPTLGAEFLPMLYDELFPAWPNARIFIDEGTCQNHIDHLKAGVINLAYNGIPTSIDTDSLEILPVTTSEICVLMHPDHPLSDRETVSIKELESEMLAMLGSSSIMRSLVLREFEKQGCIPNIVSNHEQISCMIQMIHLGNYIGFINTNKRHFASGCQNLVIRPLSDPVYMQAGFIKKKGKTLTRLEDEVVSFVKSMYP